MDNFFSTNVASLRNCIKALRAPLFLTTPSPLGPPQAYVPIPTVTQCLGLRLSWVSWCLPSNSVLPFLMGRPHPLQGPDSQVAFAGIQTAPF